MSCVRSDTPNGGRKGTMKTPAFENLLNRMNPTQQSALEELAKMHPDLTWDGGKPDTRPLRVSIKNAHGRNIAAINTREKDSFLRLEFRSADYSGPNSFGTNHRNFNRAFDLITASSISKAADIVSVVKQNYSFS